MISGRGTHHVDEAQPSPDTDDVEHGVDDDEKTPLLWWVKTIASWTLLAAAVALLAALVVVPRLTGSTAYTVLTGSMEPTYPPGTLIVVKPTPGDQLKAGDVITFRPKSGDPSVTTHRIISIVYDASGTRRFITKGDANNSTDPVQLVEEQIRGRLIYSIPKLGYLNNVMSGNSRSIAVFLIAGALGLYALWMWIGSIRDRKKPKDGDPEPTDKADAPPPGPESGETSSSEWPAADPGTLGSLVVTAAPATDVVATPAVVAPQPDPYEYASAPSPAPTPVQPLGGHAGSPSARMFPAQQMAVPHAYSPSPCHVCGAPAPPPAEPLADVPSTATTRPIPIIK